jgi:hypothetical protein
VPELLSPWPDECGGRETGVPYVKFLVRASREKRRSAPARIPATLVGSDERSARWRRATLSPPGSPRRALLGGRGSGVLSKHSPRPASNSRSPSTDYDDGGLRGGPRVPLSDALGPSDFRKNARAWRSKWARPQRSSTARSTAPDGLT